MGFYWAVKWDIAKETGLAAKMVALLAVMKELYWVGDLVDKKESELAVLKDSE